MYCFIFPATNKNTVPGDVSAMVPGGIRIGTCAMTSRGLTEKDFEKVAEFFDDAVSITLELKKSLPSKKLKDFKEAVATYEKAVESAPKIAELRSKKHISVFT